MLMLAILAQQATAQPGSSELASFLKYGQIGLALGIVVVGAGLFTAAVRQQNLSETTARVLKLFAIVMVILFVVASIGEFATPLATRYMDSLEKHNERQDTRNTLFVAEIYLPQLINGDDYKEFGPVEIIVSDKSHSERVAADQVRPFSVHDGARFTIDLGKPINQLRNFHIKNMSLAKTTVGKDGGGEAPQ